MDTPVFRAVMEAVHTVIPAYESNHIEVQHPDSQRNPVVFTHDLEDDWLPPDFKRRKIPEQAALCIEQMILWAHDRKESAAICCDFGFSSRRKGDGTDCSSVDVLF